MTRWNSIGVIAWALVLVLAVGAVLSFSYVKSVLGNATEQVHQAQAIADELRLRSARLDSQLDAFDAQGRENVQFLEQQGRQMAAMRAFCTSERISGNRDLGYVCGNTPTLSQVDFGQFLVLENKAAAQRGRGNFAASIERYREASEKWPDIKNQYVDVADGFALRQMILLEGQAYGLYRLGKLDEAEQAIDKALELANPDTRAVSGFVYSTKMKIACKRDAPGFDAQSAYDRYLAILDSALSRDRARVRANTAGYMAASLNDWVEFRTDDRRYFAQDREMKIVCGLG